MFAKKKFNVDGVWMTWIDFPKWHELVNSGVDFKVEDYWKKTPQVGISGKGTIDRAPEHVRERLIKEHPEIFVAEDVEEMELE
jgi:tRNA wybutosine-synthesizing protein 1